LEIFAVPFFWIRDFLDWDSCSLQVCWRKWIDCIHVWTYLRATLLLVQEFASNRSGFFLSFFS
jgi:hypothetical protein